MKKINRGNIFLIFVMLINIILPLATNHIFHMKMNNSNFIYAIREVICPGLVIVIYFIITKQNPMKIIKFKKINLKNTIFIIFLTFTAIPISLVISYITNIIFQNQLLTSQIKSMSTNNSFLAVILITALQPAIIEEISFRGIIAHSFSDYSVKIMAVMTGLYFGMFHLNFNQFFFAAFYGIIMVFVLYYTKSIFATMIMHFINNGISVVVAKSLSPKLPNMVRFSLNAHIIAYSLLIIILAIDLLIFYKLFKAFIKYNKKRLGNDLMITYEGGEQNLKVTKKNLRKILLTPSFLAIVVIFLAASLYIQIRGHNANSAYDYTSKGLSFVKIQQYDKAITDFDKAIELYPKMEIAYADRGLVYIITQKYDQAIADFNKVIELNPNYEYACNSYLGLAYMKTQRYDQAIINYKKAIQSHPKDENAIRNLKYCEDMIKQ